MGQTVTESIKLVLKVGNIGEDQSNEDLNLRVGSQGSMVSSSFNMLNIALSRLSAGQK